MSDVQPQRGDAETAGQDRRQTSDVTREPTGGQGLREAMERWLRDRVQVPEHRAITASFAVLALPELAALIADADNWRRVTKGDPAEPEPLAMQARTLLVKLRRVETLATTWERCAADEAGADLRIWAAALRRALDGEPQP